MHKPQGNILNRLSLFAKMPFKVLQYNFTIKHVSAQIERLNILTVEKYLKHKENPPNTQELKVFATYQEQGP
jgi:hypothetical protein